MPPFLCQGKKHRASTLSRGPRNKGNKANRAHSFDTLWRAQCEKAAPPAGRRYKAANVKPARREGGRYITNGNVVRPEGGSATMPTPTCPY